MSSSRCPLKRIASRSKAKLATLVAALAALAHGAVATAAPDTYRVDPERSSTEFAVSHLGLSTQRGHFGRMEGTSERVYATVAGAEGSPAFSSRAQAERNSNSLELVLCHK